MTDRYNSYLDDWLPEDNEDDIEGSYDYDYDSVPKEPEPSLELTIDQYEDSRQNDHESSENEDFYWIYWR